MLLLLPASQAERASCSASITRGPVWGHRSVETHRPGEDGRATHIRTQKMGDVMVGLLLPAVVRARLRGPSPVVCVCVVINYIKANKHGTLTLTLSSLSRLATQ